MVTWLACFTRSIYSHFIHASDFSFLFLHFSQPRSSLLLIHSSLIHLSSGHVVCFSLSPSVSDTNSKASNPCCVPTIDTGSGERPLCPAIFEYLCLPFFPRRPPKRPSHKKSHKTAKKKPNRPDPEPQPVPSISFPSSSVHSVHSVPTSITINLEGSQGSGREGVSPQASSPPQTATLPPGYRPRRSNSARSHRQSRQSGQQQRERSQSITPSQSISNRGRSEESRPHRHSRPSHRSQHLGDAIPSSHRHHQRRRRRHHRSSRQQDR